MTDPTYHMVSGRYTAANLMKMIKDGGGEAKLKTVQGGTLTAIPGRSGKSLFLTDANVVQTNGVIHLVNGVLMP